MRQILTLVFLSGLLFTVTGCGNVDNGSLPTSTVPLVSSTTETVNTSTITTTSTVVVSTSSPVVVPTTTTVSSTSTLVTSSTIDQNNQATWPRYYFKDLGFSIQAPFPKSEVSQIFHDCTKPEDRCDNEARIYVQTGEYVDKVNMYWFSGKLGKISISSYSQNYASGGESGLEVYDLIKTGNDYFILSSGGNGYKWTIHPLSIFTDFKTPIIYFDGYRDYIRVVEIAHGDKVGGKYYGAVFKLPYSKKFKATVLFFDEKDLSQLKFLSILKTIRFEE